MDPKSDQVDIADFLRRQAVYVRRRERSDPQRRAEADWWVRRIETLRIERDAAFGGHPKPVSQFEEAHR